MSGKVFIVGAGPGDPRLITLRGLECIRAADVIVYDRLVHPSLLDEAPPGAERIYAGKESNRHTLPQDRINELLGTHAAAGRTVVRLKGGDPMVLGRGGEEAAFLADREIPFEIVPGVTSAISVLAFAGIPVTHRGVSNSFAVATGHECGLDSAPDYAALFRSAGTLVILMGVKNLPKIVAQMLSAGIDPETPVAAIEEGTMETQHTLVTTLQGILKDGSGLKAPAVIVVGSVVLLRDRLQWFREAAQLSPAPS
jgi:uroporphyrin-III C-methyltransferase